jgi:ribosomal protein S18 acetylase RimI-like enzyme
MERWIIERWSETEPPYSLLLLADETIDAINKYIFQCETYVLKLVATNEYIGVFAIKETSPQELEIKNIAVVENFRGHGLGREMIIYVKKLAKLRNYSQLTVGTSDTGCEQLRFYKQNGFVQTGVKSNFFIENYQEPIIENGKQMRDMIMLTYQWE